MTQPLHFLEKKSCRHFRKEYSKWQIRDFYFYFLSLPQAENVNAGRDQSVSKNNKSILSKRTLGLQAAVVGSDFPRGRGHRDEVQESRKL